MNARQTPRQQRRCAPVRGYRALGNGIGTVVRALAVLLALALSGNQVVSAACSGYLGFATINEVYKKTQSGSGTDDYFLEVKILDSALLAQPGIWQQWSVSICSDRGAREGDPCTTVTVTQDDEPNAWIVLDEDDIGWPYLDLGAGNKHGMEVVLLDASGNVIDYLSIDGYASSGPYACDYLYDTTFEGSNGFNIQRKPDGVGDWDTTGGGESGDDTTDDTNDKPPDGLDLPYVEIVDIDVAPGADAVFTVSLTDQNGLPRTFGEPVVLEWFTYDGSATAADGDYAEVSSREVVIPAGDSSAPLSVRTFGTATVGEFFYIIAMVKSETRYGGSDYTNAILTDNLARALFVVGGPASLGVDGPPSASTCRAVEVTLGAYDSSNALIPDYAGQVTLTTSSGHGTWAVTGTGGAPSADPAQGALNDGAADDGAASYTFAPADGGQVVLWLANVHADDLTVTAVDGPAGVSASSALIGFRDNALVITATDALGNELVAARPHGFEAQLWRRDSATGLCGIASAYAGDYPLKAWIARDADDPGGTAPYVGAAGLPNAPPGGNNITLTFVNGVAAFALDTSDAGKWTVSLRDDTSGFATDAGGGPRPIDGSSALLTTRPFALGFSGIERGASANPGGTAAGGSGFAAAGETFAATLGGYRWQAADDGDNDGTPDSGADVTDNGRVASYAWATTLSASLDTPVGGTPGVLGGTTGLSAAGFSAGQATVSDLSYSEVGSVTLQAAAADFLNTGGVDIAGESPVVGRFYPASFALAGAAVTPADAVGGYSYMGQPFTVAYTLEALNLAGDVTVNYDAALYTVGVANAITVAEDADDGIERSARLTVAAADWVAGRYLVNDSVATFARQAVPDGPFDDLAIGVRATGDPDGAALQGLDMNPAAAGCGGACDARRLDVTMIRYGRLAMVPSFGSELIDLQVPVQAEYYDGMGFRVHALDGASEGIAMTLTDPDPSDGLSVSETCAWELPASADASGIACGPDGPAAHAWSEPPSLGSFNLWLSAPGAGNDGALDVTATVPPWLSFGWGGGTPTGPAARVTFGIHRGQQGVIYRREMY